MLTTDVEIIPPAPRTASLRQRRRSHLTTWSPVILALLGLGLLAGRAYGGIANAHWARLSSSRELRWTLLPGEILLAEVPAAQRYWWNYFSETHGVLAITDRRVIFVGAEPPSFTAPKDGPPTFETREFPHDRPLMLSAGPVFMGSAVGLVIETPESRETIAFDGVRDGHSRMSEVVRAIDDARATHRREVELDALANMPAPPPPPIYRQHYVRRGETLGTIAWRNGITADELRQLNEITGDAIQAGQRLVVPVIPF